MKSVYPVPLTVNQPLLEFFLFSGGLLVCLFHPFKIFWLIFTGYNYNLMHIMVLFFKTSHFNELILKL